MSDEQNLILILIATGKTPLASYSPFVGEFLHMCETLLPQVASNSSAQVTYGDYMIYYMNANNITYLIITVPSYSKVTAISCLESLRRELKDIINEKDLDEISDYGLDEILKPKLEMKHKFYNVNTEITGEALERAKKEVEKMEKRVIKAQDQFLERNDKIKEMENKAVEMAEHSVQLKREAKKVKKTDSRRKVCIYLAIILVVLAIIYGIICMTCQSFVFDCSK